MILEKAIKTTNYNSTTKNINLAKKTKATLRDVYEQKLHYLLTL